MSKKVLYGILAGLMSVGVLAACGDVDDPDMDTDTEMEMDQDVDGDDGEMDG
ncbi:hypothetical protein [Alteribacter natronophilus]|uniref:hypothetical protein n=1 Tax=Alteribacter natronophilus TaxID=2583810 RepID=UPI001486851A|nr:hypothetical protein [Alteribacter natronophilus]